MTVTWAKKGDTMIVPERDDAHGPMMIRPLCVDQPSFGYWCEPCREFLANVGNLLMHLEIAGDHVIAAYCRKHWGYEAPDDAQMRALIGEAA